MSSFKSQVGNWKLHWKSIPRGRQGKTWVEVEGQGSLEVHWRIDQQGVWLQTEASVKGFDLRSDVDDSGEKCYHATQRYFHQEWSAISVSSGDTGSRLAHVDTKAKVARVRAQMPGKIIRVMVKLDQLIEKDQPLMVMEAMKMENEIRAPLSGKVTQLHVIEGQAVETGFELLRIEPVAD